jgi:hypothetical protein
MSRTSSYATQTTPARTSEQDGLSYTYSTITSNPRPSRVREWINLLSPKAWRRNSTAIRMMNEREDILDSSSPVRPILNHSDSRALKSKQREKERKYPI